MSINGKNTEKSMLRFTTAGSVDDGKSTLIGRLLYDSKSIFEDQMDHIVQSSQRLGREEVDLSLLTDGLRAEREQGITIDVAYRYFATPARKFIIADTPGHIQYTRNMVTGASTADLAVVLVDARKGVLEQTLRHAYIATLLDIRHIVFCINKMDMVEYAESVFNKIMSDLGIIADKLGVEDPRYIPISAKYGDNVVDRSDKMNWYNGPTFLSFIENVEIKKDKGSTIKRFPVQTVIRPQSDSYHDYRGYAGRVASGTFRPGDEIVVMPSMARSRVKTVDVFEKSLDSCSVGESVTIALEDQIDISRGDIFVGGDDMPTNGQDIDVMLCWFNERPLQINGRYMVRNYSNDAICAVKSVENKININTLENEYADLAVKMNDIARIRLRSSRPLIYDSYKKNNITGSLILIDESTNETVAAGMII
ncbi:MAG: GTP-binding protein [Bacteroidales bacterium]